MAVSKFLILSCASSIIFAGILEDITESLMAKTKGDLDYAKSYGRVLRRNALAIDAGHDAYQRARDARNKAHSASLLAKDLQENIHHHEKWHNYFRKESAKFFGAGAFDNSYAEFIHERAATYNNEALVDVHGAMTRLNLEK